MIRRKTVGLGFITVALILEQSVRGDEAWQPQSQAGETTDGVMREIDLRISHRDTEAQSKAKMRRESLRPF